MKLLGSLAFSLALVATSSAMAADLGWGGGATSPGTNLMTPVSASNWTGFYIGAAGGYGFGQLTRAPVGGGASTDTPANGWQGGVTAGYNFDMGGLVLGAETDVMLTNLQTTESLGAPNTLRTGVDFYGTARLRAGAAVGQVMPYVTGGLALARGSMSVTNEVSGISTSQNNTHWGWTVGGGLEAAATENVTLKAEFLYVDLQPAAYGVMPGGSVNADHNFAVVRAGVNYRF